MCCAQGVVHITMAELPTMPFTHYKEGGKFLHADFSKSAVSGRFEKNLQTRGWGGGFLQAHVSNCPVADLRKSANLGGREFLQAHVSNCPVADLRKSAKGGGNLQAHVSNCSVADSSTCICKLGGIFCMQISVNLHDLSKFFS